MLWHHSCPRLTCCGAYCNSRVYMTWCTVLLWCTVRMQAPEAGAVIIGSFGASQDKEASNCASSVAKNVATTRLAAQALPGLPWWRFPACCGAQVLKKYRGQTFCTMTRHPLGQPCARCRSQQLARCPVSCVLHRSLTFPKRTARCSCCCRYFTYHKDGDAELECMECSPAYA